MYIDYLLAIFHFSKSNSQRQAEWKQKNLEKSKIENVIKNKAYRERLKNRMTEKEKQMNREKEAERKRQFRMKKKGIIAPTPGPTFATAQVKGKLLKRTRETLRGTPVQNLKVLKILIDEVSGENIVPTPGRKGLPDETVKKVTSFYLNDEISRTSPNRKDYVTVMENNTKKKVSVKHLMYSINEVYAMFCKENPDVKVSR